MDFSNNRALTAGQLLRDTSRRLESAGITASDFEARQLVLHCLSLSPAEFILKKNETVENKGLLKLKNLLEKRISGEPLQYLLGSWEFYGLPFHVGEGVLIPRPDTEVLVDTALDNLRSVKKDNLSILELCAGSGCISIAIAKTMPGVSVTAIEKYDQAFAYFLRNIKENNIANVTPVLADLFDGIDGLKNQNKEIKYDLVVSNPPYIATEAIKVLMPEVQREPVTALDGGIDGYLFYRAILDLWLPALNFGCKLMVETGIGQAEYVKKLFTEAGLMDISAFKDISGVQRVIVGTYIG